MESCRNAQRLGNPGDVKGVVTRQLSASEIREVRLTVPPSSHIRRTEQL